MSPKSARFEIVIISLLDASTCALNKTRYNRAMVKRFLRFLIVALTLQLTWGVASAYCGHETGQASQHFGHHLHQHQGSGSSDENGDDGSPSPNKIGGDPDCATCAHSPASVFPFNSTLLIVAIVSHDRLPSLTGQPPPYLGAPERPQWIVAV